MSAQENASENFAGDTSRAAEQSDRAADKSDEAGSYRSERYPEDPESAAPPVDNAQVSEPPRSD